MFIKIIENNVRGMGGRWYEPIRWKMGIALYTLRPLFDRKSSNTTDKGGWYYLQNELVHCFVFFSPQSGFFVTDSAG